MANTEHVVHGGYIVLFPGVGLVEDWEAVNGSPDNIEKDI